MLDTGEWRKVLQLIITDKNVGGFWTRCMNTVKILIFFSLFSNSPDLYSLYRLWWEDIIALDKKLIDSFPMATPSLFFLSVNRTMQVLTLQVHLISSTWLLLSILISMEAVRMYLVFHVLPLDFDLGFIKWMNDTVFYTNYMTCKDYMFFSWIGFNI